MNTLLHANTFKNYFKGSNLFANSFLDQIKYGINNVLQLKYSKSIDAIYL